MLQVSNLTKIYKTKGGVEVKALDNVSVSFPETGMVFLLGKSGSGKSTLLNVCGGLDSPTQGEIIVKGRSSKNFSQSDFDSYRNTFIGFIFQEYNILNEFSVEDNIALALELQGKSKDKKAIAALLEDVDLAGYAKRKPNTLSGGQKQRIAIARALVKAPEIIMADEPTGALDSATGKQVFDTLKKLSKSKLVLVVSHDRDFAEQYGDRIIELKDGQIISDVSKAQEEQRAVSKNVTFIGSTISVKNGADLTDKDFNEIKTFLKSVKGDVMIASGEKEVQDFRAVSRITADGQKEIFRDTDESAIERKAYSPKDSKFIRSRLPARHAMKIGVSGLKTKPVRLFFTILLCTMAFILFGLASTMTFYDSAATFKRTFIDSDLSIVRAVKEYRVKETYYYNGKQESTWNSYHEAAFTSEEVQGYMQQFGSDAFGGVSVDARIPTQDYSDYWRSEVETFAFLSDNNNLRNKINGRYPTKDDEVVLTTYTAQVAIECKGYDAYGNPLNLQKVEDLISKTVQLGSTYYEVVGLMPVDDLPEKFNPIRDKEEHSWELEMQLQNTLQESLFLVGFVTENALLEAAKSSNSDSGNTDNYYERPIAIASSKDENGNYVYPGHGGSDGYYLRASSVASSIVYLKNGTTSVGDTETAISRYMFYDLARKAYEAKSNEVAVDAGDIMISWCNANEEAFSKWAQEKREQGEDVPYINSGELLDAWVTEKAKAPDQSDAKLYALYQSYLDTGLKAKYDLYEIYYSALKKVETLHNGWEYVTDEFGGGQDIKLTAQRRKEIADELIAAMQRDNVSLQVSIKLYNQEQGSVAGAEHVFDIVGAVDLYSNGTLYSDSYLYLNDNQVNTLWDMQKEFFNSWGYSDYTTNYVPDENEIFDTVFLPYDHSKGVTNLLHSIYKNKSVLDERDTRVTIESSLVENLEMIDSMISMLSKVFLWAGVAMAAFAALLLSNFISVSISYKKRDIGILRAVGARGTDVFKIFFSESFVITAICAVLSILCTFVLCQVLNAQIGASLGASIFNFGIFSLATLLTIALLTALLATSLPVWLAARKKPVDSIRAL